jgi:hypothetical protein
VPKTRNQFATIGNREELQEIYEQDWYVSTPRPDPRPYQHLSLIWAFSFSLSMWRFMAVICGGRGILFDWRRGVW